MGTDRTGSEVGAGSGDGAQPASDDGEEYQVGPGCPPLEHRWRKGCRSPNPTGRPPKKRVYSMLQISDPLTAAVLEHGQTQIPLRNGKRMTVSRIEANLDSLFKQSLTGATKASIAYHAIQQAAAAERKVKFDKGLLAAMEHQEAWMEKFLEAEASGRPLPEICPDPRDLVITPEGIVPLGPTNRADKLQDDKILNLREILAEDWLEIARSDLPEGDKRRLKRKTLKMFNAYNELLSLKHQVTFAEFMSKFET